MVVMPDPDWSAYKRDVLALVEGEECRVGGGEPLEDHGSDAANFDFSEIIILQVRQF